QFTKFNLDKVQKLDPVKTKDVSIYSYDLRIEDIDGTVHQLDKFKGEVVFINFWASWCVPCLAEFSSLSVLIQKLPEVRFAIIGLEDAKSFKKYISKTKHELPFYRQLTPLPGQINPSAVPSSFVIDRDGKVIYKYLGAADWESNQVADQIKSLL
ncbi:MAG: TlpA disulfide reductase family protein, partial [Salibacteraceae bacterium]